VGRSARSPPRLPILLPFAEAVRELLRVGADAAALDASRRLPVHCVRMLDTAADSTSSDLVAAAVSLAQAACGRVPHPAARGYKGVEGVSSSRPSGAAAGLGLATDPSAGLQHAFDAALDAVFAARGAAVGDASVRASAVVESKWGDGDDAAAVIGEAAPTGQLHAGGSADRSATYDSVLSSAGVSGWRDASGSTFSDPPPADSSSSNSVLHRCVTNGGSVDHELDATGIPSCVVVAACMPAPVLAALSVHQATITGAEVVQAQGDWDAWGGWKWC